MAFDPVPNPPPLVALGGTPEVEPHVILELKVLDVSGLAFRTACWSTAWQPPDFECQGARSGSSGVKVARRSVVRLFIRSVVRLPQ